MFKLVRDWFRRRKYRKGRILSVFVARDIRRDVLVVSAAKIEEGIITGQVRTVNVLHVAKGLIPQPEFDAPRELNVTTLWSVSDKA